MPRIVVVDADPTWPAAFARTAAAIRAAIGPDAGALHHIGSTSVPGLAAKPILDLQLTVADLDAPLEAALAPLGFGATQIRVDHCPPGLDLAPEELGKRFFKGAGLDPVVNLHVRQAGRFNQRYPLLFRDFLRATPMAAHAYAAIKRELARRFPDDMDAYYEIKDPVCDALMAGAHEWAARVGWTPGPCEG